MFKLTLTNANGQIETIDMSEVNFYAAYDRFVANNIPDSAYNCTMGKMKEPNYPVKISSDSDVGNAILKMFIDRESVYDIYQVEHGLSRIRDEYKDELEQNILNEQYRYPEYIFEGLNDMMKESAAQRITFYCPLAGNIHFAEDGDYGDAYNDTLLENYDAIEEKLANEQAPEMNMAEYVGDHAELKDKLLLAQWGIEEISGILYGTIDCYLSEPISPEETERLRKAIGGQNSDGFGESFEQKEIPIDEGNLYVSFWHSGDDYFLHTDAEMNDYLSQLSGMRFGGMA